MRTLIFLGCRIFALTAGVVLGFAGPVASQILSEHVTIAGSPYDGGAPCDAAPRCEGEDWVPSLGMMAFHLYLPSLDWGPTDSLRFSVSWPEAWTIHEVTTCQGTVIAEGNPTENGDLLVLDTDCDADLDRPFLRYVVDCPTGGRFTIGDDQEGRIQGFVCGPDRWQGWYEQRWVEVGDRCGADAHGGVCETYCSRQPAGRFDPSQLSVDVPVGGTTTQTCVVRGSTSTECTCGGFWHCGSSICTGDPCLSMITEEIPWLELELLSSVDNYVHTYLMTIDATDLDVGTYEDQIHALTDCGIDCKPSCMAVTANVQKALSVGGAASAPILAMGNVRPNPSPGTVSVPFTLSEATEVVVRVFDVGGRTAGTIAAGVFPAGGHTVEWGGHGPEGEPPAPGVYYVRVEVGDHRVTRRVVLAR
jgi:hypothetical protein